MAGFISLLLFCLFIRLTIEKAIADDSMSKAVKQYKMIKRNVSQIIALNDNVTSQVLIIIITYVFIVFYTMVIFKTYKHDNKKIVSVSFGARMDKLNFY